MAIMAAMGMTLAPIMTDHALEGHQGQAANASTIVDCLADQLNGNSNGDDKCDQLDLHICRKYRGTKSPHAKVLCHKGDKIDGLIIGLRDGTPKVVTGYRARRSYWLNSITRDQCIPLNLDMLEAYFRMMFPGVLQ